METTRSIHVVFCTLHSTIYKSYGDVCLVDISLILYLIVPFWYASAAYQVSLVPRGGGGGTKKNLIRA